MSKELLQPNHVAATLFVGVGGIGSKIVKRVAEKCINDDIDAVRFVTLDTDVNDLEKLENGATITTIQTSSPRSVRDYLEDDTRAKNDWFPVNNIISDKTVSEGAGQVRAISRLALNATIKNGNISRLYKAIDDLFLKNGNDKNQAVKVVIASTAAGGTGSGIAMVVGMLIRHYLKKHYPESAAIIRGFLLLPGVMDTVISNQSERDSLRRNGYATIKEINAFMMKGSGFFESERRLQRYKDLHVTIPTTGGGYEDIDNLPFDFCFLLDRTDGIQRSMKGLDQYREYAAQSLYEQNIGSMRSSAASKEDNVIREFTDRDKLGRCRFGGIGAAAVRYPYDDICEYLALDWTQKLLFGKIDDSLSDEERDSLISRTWLRYDAEYERARKKFDSDMNASANDEPKRSEIYINSIENAEGDNFSDALFSKHLKPKISQVLKIDSRKQLKNGAKKLVDSYFETLVEEALKNKVLAELDRDGRMKVAKDESSENGYKDRYDAIEALEGLGRNARTEGITTSFVRSVFESEAPLSQRDLGKYTLQRFLSKDGTALHPNAVRYLLYKLLDKMTATESRNAEDRNFESDISDIKFNSDTKRYNVGAVAGSENSLSDMCIACDSIKAGHEVINSLLGQNPESNCRNYLNEYAARVERNIKNVITRIICIVGRPYVENLIRAYEKFYASFKDKAVSIDKEKDFVTKKIQFRKGDCVWNLFNQPEYLEMLAEQMKGTDSSSAADEKLFAEVYNLVRENAVIEERNSYDKYSNETTHDIFDECMIGYYRRLVEEQKKDDLDIDILHAIKLEYKIKCDIEKKAATESQKEAIAKRAKDSAAISAYIRKTIDKGRNLATPGICKKSFDESRDVNAIAYSKFIKDGSGLRVSDYFDEKDATDTVSKYEIRFFRSVYVIMPTQIFQFLAPRTDSDVDEKPRIDLNDTSDNGGAGESFLKYQEYMEDIGPDSRMTSVITPHIDSRWSSISVMPELDLDYQDKLMKHIHKAMFYGFVYGIISLFRPSKYDSKKFIYRYRDGNNGFKPLIVSNKTKCDKLYEVLDSLYFDRAAVKAIHSIAFETRAVDEKDSVGYEKTAFKKNINGFSRTNLIGKIEIEGEEEANTADTSVFELPVLYFNSLPPRLRDGAEIEIMVDAIIETIETEVKAFSDANDTYPFLGHLLAKHYNLLYKNYKKFPTLLGKGVDINSNDVMLIIRKKVEDKLISIDVTMPKLGDA